MTAMGPRVGGRDCLLLAVTTALVLPMRPPGEAPLLPRPSPGNPRYTHAGPCLMQLLNPPEGCSLMSPLGVGQEDQLESWSGPGPVS